MAHESNLRSRFARRAPRPRLLVAAVAVMGLAASLAAAPAAAFDLNVCLGDGDWPARAAVGESVGRSGNYTDPAQPGSIRAVFSGPSGQEKTVEDIVEADGHWEMGLRFRASEAGRWSIRTTFSEPGATTITCYDHITVVGMSAPDTSTAAGADEDQRPKAPVELLIAGLAGLAWWWRRVGRAG